MATTPSAGTIRRVVSTRLPTRWAVFQAIGYEREVVNGDRRIETAVALTLGNMTYGAPLVRVHSQCFTGDVLGSMRCDCGGQLEIAMQAIAREGRGLLIYEHQEGRGIGLMAKLRAYELQNIGFDTVEANRVMGFSADYRDYQLPIAILRNLGVERVRLLSNNPDKVRALSDAGIAVVAQVPCEVAPNQHSSAYLRTKKEKMGHALSLDDAFEFARIEDALRELRAGRMIVVVDDTDRENEGDLVIAAEAITPEAINFMATHGRGLICLALSGQRLDELGLPQVSPANDALGGTAFAASIDLKGCGVTTGISAYDRAYTIKAAVNIVFSREDFVVPGHVFPLRARAGGVLERRGHTEAAVDLAILAGCSPAGVICEVLNDDGTMARLPDLRRFCTRHNLAIITVADLVRHRLESASRPQSAEGHDHDSYALPWPSRSVLSRADGAGVGRDSADFS